MKKNSFQAPEFISQYPSEYLDFSRVARKLYTYAHANIYSCWISTVPEYKLWDLLHPRNPPQRLTQQEMAMLAEFTHLYLLEEYSKHPKWHTYIYDHILPNWEHLHPSNQ